MVVPVECESVGPVSVGPVIALIELENEDDAEGQRPIEHGLLAIDEQRSDQVVVDDEHDQEGCDDCP